MAEMNWYEWHWHLEPPSVQACSDAKNRLMSLLLHKTQILDLVGQWKTEEALLRSDLALIESCQQVNLALKAQLKNQLSEVLRKKGNYEESLIQSFEAQTLSETAGDQQTLANVIGAIGITYYYQGNYDMAVESYQKSLRIYETLDNKKDIAETFGKIGIVYEHRGDYENAIAYIQRQITIAEELHHKRTAGMALGRMGIVFTSLSNYEKAMECYQKYLAIVSELGDKGGLNVVLGNIGLIYTYQHNYEKAMEYYDLNLKLSKELANKRSLSLTVGNMGMAHFDQGHYEKAMTCFKMKRKLAEELGDKHGLSIACFNLGQLYAAKFEYDHAIECYDHAISIGRELKIPLYLCGYLCYRAELFYRMGDLAKAKFLNDDALEIAEKVGYKEVIFASKVLAVKINLQDSGSITSLATLEQMLNDTKDDSEKAILHYELWQMKSKVLSSTFNVQSSTSEVQSLKFNVQSDDPNVELETLNVELNQHRQTAIERYQQLYQKTPNFEYKKRLEELQNG